MKTTLQFILVLLLSFGSRQMEAQSLSNAQVYDFNVGDIILSNYHNYGMWGNSGPPSYTTQTVLSKFYSSNADTLYYTFQSETYQPAACQACTASYSSAITSQFIVDLDSVAVHGNQTTCFAIEDTSYFAFCNKQVWEKHSVIDTGCFEPVTNTTLLIAGLGGPYFEKYEPMGPMYSEHKLMAYRKFQDTCGVLLSIYEKTDPAESAINVFPNPVSTALQFSNTKDYASFCIFDSFGRMLMNSQIQGSNVDVSKLKNGTYLISFYGVNKPIANRRFQKI